MSTKVADKFVCLVDVHRGVSTNGRELHDLLQSVEPG